MTDAALRNDVYRRLTRRNRRVRVLRIVVPIVGAVVLVGLLVQIFLASVGSRFEIGQITITPDAVSIAAPEYVGVMEDGSAYRVSAETAHASMAQSDMIDLTNAKVVVNRADGVQLTADAARAVLDTTNRQIVVEGTTDIADSTGTTGTLENSVFDWEKQVLTTNGPVAIDYADGSSVRALGLIYDAKTAGWTFASSTVTLPETPGDYSSGTTAPTASGDTAP